MTSNTGTTKSSAVIVRPSAFVSMAYHAIRYRNESVHGVLLGTQQEPPGTVIVEHAVPVSHGVPTKPVVETALGLIESSQILSTSTKIVGWYTAPMLQDDTSPGPVALRMAASLATSSSSKDEPVLLVIQNNALGDIVGTKGSSSPTSSTTESASILQGYGSDNSKQWTRSIPVNIDDTIKAYKATKEAQEQKILPQVDIMDHLNDRDPTSISSWSIDQNQKDVVELVKKC